MEKAAKAPRAFQEDAKRRRIRDSENLFALTTEKHSAKQSGISELLVELEQRLRALRAIRKLDPAQCAEEILAILRELVRFDGVSASLDFELPHFLQTLWAEAPIRALVEDILRAARAVLSPNSTIQLRESYQPDRRIAQLDFFLDWYAQRRAALCLFGDHNLYGAAAVLVQSVVHDQVFLGERGFEVVSTVRVDGLEFQSLWLSVALFHEGNQVRVKNGWEYWAGDSELFVLPRGRAQDAREQYASSVMPIIPHDQRAIYHGLKLFIPYAALDLPPNSRQQIDCEVSLLSSSGSVLSADACTETLALPGGAAASSAATAAPSPAALGFWARNVGNGDSVSLLSVEQERRVEARREIHSLRIHGDLLLVNRREQSLTLEVRFLTREGNLIESEFPSFSARDGAFLYRSTIVPGEIIARYPSLACSIPLVALELDAGTHELLAELIVLDQEREIVCGAVRLIELTVTSPIPGQRVEIDEIDAMLPEKIDSTLYIEHVTIDSNHVFNSRDAIRAEIFFIDHAVQSELMQIRAVLRAAHPDSRQPERSIVRGLSFFRQSGRHEHSAVFVFDCDDVLRMASGVTNERLLHLEIQVFDARGETQLSARRTFTVKPHFGVERLVPTNSLYGRHHVEIVDAQLRETPQRGGEMLIELVTNFDLLSTEKTPYSLYVEPLSKPRDAKAVERISPDGFLVEIPPPAIEAALTTHRALFQEPRYVRVPQALRASGARALKMMLFSPSGRLLQVVYQRLAPSSLIDRPISAAQPQ